MEAKLIANPLRSLNHIVRRMEIGSSVLPVKNTPLIKASGRMNQMLGQNDLAIVQSATTETAIGSSFLASFVL